MPLAVRRGTERRRGREGAGRTAAGGGGLPLPPTRSWRGWVAPLGLFGSRRGRLPRPVFAGVPRTGRAAPFRLDMLVDAVRGFPLEDLWVRGRRPRESGRAAEGARRRRAAPTERSSSANPGFFLHGLGIRTGRGACPCPSVREDDFYQRACRRVFGLRRRFFLASQRDL